jgi:hypothetical protein
MLLQSRCDKSNKQNLNKATPTVVIERWMTMNTDLCLGTTKLWDTLQRVTIHVLEAIIAVMSGQMNDHMTSDPSAMFV